MIKQATTIADIEKCTAAIIALRPHLLVADLPDMLMQMFTEGYQLLYYETTDGNTAAIIGYRYLQYLYNGKHFYIDDLSTLPEYRGKGYAGMLLDHVIELAKEQGYNCVTLDSGYMRNDAHRLYLNKGFVLACHHFSKQL
jgi:GNAT superfamily N-acetyltransferase